MLVSNQGHLMQCPGAAPASGGNWPCSPLAEIGRLPLAEGSRLAAAATTWLPSHSGARLHAVLVDESAPDLASLFVLEGKDGEASWLPLGELVMPKGRVVSLSFVDGELLIGTEAGQVIRRSVQDGVVTSSAVHSFKKSANSDSSWRAVCGLPDTGAVAHLQLRRPAASLAWRPEVSTAEAKARALAEEPILIN